MCIRDRHTRLGLYTYAVGSNAQAARLTGISFAGIKIFAFAFTGLACGIAGIMTAARMMTATTEIGVGMEFNVIAAIVIGGCSLQAVSYTHLDVYKRQLKRNLFPNSLVCAPPGCEFLKMMIKL